jgi:hypothetical protein
MRKFIKDFFTYPFQKDKSDNKRNLMMTSLFKDFPANFWIKPKFKKIFVVPLLVLYYMFTKWTKKDKSK